MSLVAKWTLKIVNFVKLVIICSPHLRQERVNSQCGDEEENRDERQYSTGLNVTNCPVKLLETDQGDWHFSKLSPAFISVHASNTISVKEESTFFFVCLLDWIL